MILSDSIWLLLLFALAKNPYLMENRRLIETYFQHRYLLVLNKSKATLLISCLSLNSCSLFEILRPIRENSLHNPHPRLRSGVGCGTAADDGNSLLYVCLCRCDAASNE